MDSNGKNGLFQNGAAGVTQEAPSTESGEDLSLEDEEKEKTDAKELGPASKRKSIRLIGAILVILVLAAAGAAAWLFPNGRMKIRIPVREPARNPESTTARSNNDGSMTTEAINDIRNAIGAPTPLLSASPIPPTGVKGATVTATTPVTIAMDGVGSARSSATDPTAGQNGGTSAAAGAAKREEIASQRNPERSIRCAPTPTPYPARQPIVAGTLNQPSLEPAMFKRALEARVALPPFGAFLPVRTLGAIYTLRQILARFELTRDVRGDGWEMEKGTILIGQLQGSEQDRAYLNMIGLIDPASGKFVKLNGDLLGADGAPGIKGKLHKVSSTWKRVLDRAVTSGVALGQAALSRGNSNTIVLPGAVAPELISLTSTSRREFVEVSAAAPAYVLISRLPEQASGIDSPQIAAGAAENSSSPLNNNAGMTLSDEEVAGLLESGSPEAIRRAIPRMSPELRRIAETALKEADK
jgi:hypothetical protein